MEETTPTLADEARDEVKKWKGQFRHMWVAHKPQAVVGALSFLVVGLMIGRKERSNLMDLTAGYDGLEDLVSLQRQENEVLHDTIKVQALALRRLRPDLIPN